ncbi:MAG: HD domain-containing protein [Armatimonadetes bacterium]|nr:HD domain-containing protein [Armatimonadota bacterium]
MRQAGAYAEDLGNQMGGLSAPERKAIQMAGQMYDLGRLAKDGEEHVNIGIRERDGNPTLELKFNTFTEAEVPSVRAIVRHHHERWDGAGYPDGLKGEQIPRGARVLGIADRFDALVSDDYAHEGISYGKARDIMEQETRGGRFDPELVAVFFQKVVRSDQDLAQRRDDRKDLARRLERDYRGRLDRQDQDLACLLGWGAVEDHFPQPATRGMTAPISDDMRQMVEDLERAGATRGWLLS